MLSNSQNKDGGSNTTNSIITNEFLLVQESPRSFYGALYSNEEPPQYPLPTKSAEKTHNLWSSRPIFPQKTQEQKSQLPQQQQQKQKQQEQQRKKRKRKDLPDLFESTPQGSIPPHCINDRQYTWDGRKGRWIPIVLTYNFPTNAFLKGSTSANCLPFQFQTPPTPKVCSPYQTPSSHSKDNKDSFIVRSPNMKFLGYSRKRGSKVSMSPCLASYVRSNNTSPPPPAAASAQVSQPEVAQNPFLTDTLTSGGAWIDEEIDCMNDFLFSSSMLDHQAADQLLNFPPPPPPPHLPRAAAQQFTTTSTLSSSCPCSSPPTPKKKMSNSSPPIPSSPLPPLFLYDNKPIM